MRARSSSRARSARSCARRSTLMRAGYWPPPFMAPSAASGWKPFRGRRLLSTRGRSTARSRRAAVSRSRAVSNSCRPMCRWGRTGSHGVFWRSLAFWRSLPPSPRRSADASGADARIGPFLDLGGADNLFGLMRVQRPGAGRPALGEDLHGEQLGVDFRFERPSRADRPARTVVRLHRFVRAIGHIPDIRLRHGSLTPKTPEGFIFAAKRPRGVALRQIPRLESSHRALADRFDAG